jgi:hypothetical protein
MHHQAPKWTPNVIALLGVGTFHLNTSCTGVSRGTATNRGELKGTRARLPMLVADGTTRGKYGSVIDLAVGRQMIRVAEV